MSNKQEKDDKKNDVDLRKAVKKTTKKDEDGARQSTAIMKGRREGQQKRQNTSPPGRNLDPLGDILKNTKLPPIKIQWAADKLGIDVEKIGALISSGTLAREGEGINGKSFFDYYRYKCEQKPSSTEKEKVEINTQTTASRHSSLLDIVYTKSGYRITHKKSQSFHVSISRDGENNIVNILEA